MLFHYAIGLKLLVLLVFNLTQPWVATAPVYEIYYRIRKKENRVVAKELLKASRVAFKLMKNPLIKEK